MSITHLRCTTLDQITRMFTAGKAYAVRQGDGITLDITDDLGHTRTLSPGDSPRFIVGNLATSPLYAHFKPIDMDWRCSQEAKEDNR